MEIAILFSPNIFISCGTLLPTPQLALALPYQEQESFQCKAQIRHTHQYDNGLLPISPQWETALEAGPQVM